MNAGQCPDKQTLFGYITGTISEDEAETVDRHLAGCQECERTAEGLEGLSDTMITALRQPAGDDAYAEAPECGQALRELRKLPIGSSGARSLPPTIASPKKPRRVTRLGDYDLLKKLGQGGMGTVYKARHTRLKRVVALKVLPKDRLQDEVAIARFEREMEAVGRLDHPNIVRAMDAREVDRIRFLVMEYVDGLDLSEVVDRCGPLSIADASETIRQAALGLECSRENGLVHRDVKPSNLMLTAEGHIKVLDLGLAQIQEAESLGEEVTGVGQVMGTPDYISPEQALESHTVDIRTDVYSLGCTLYCLLVGHPPFAGPDYDTPMKKVTGHIRDTIPPIQVLKPDVPKPIARLLRRMLEKDPNRRVASPSEVVGVLAPFCEGSKLIGLVRHARSQDEQDESEKSRIETGELQASAMIDTSREDLGSGKKDGDSSAAAPLDPYHRWLGIPPADQPANHYGLLGLAIFENDPEVIRDAAARQMAHVRTYHLGQHAELSQEILNELGAAKACLLNPGKKAAYDAWLRVGQHSEPMDEWKPAEPPPVSAEFLASAEETVPRIRIEHPRFNRLRFNAKKPLVHACIAAGVAGLFVLLSVVLYVSTAKGRVKIVLSDPEADVELRIDGDVIEIAGPEGAIRLRPGEHELVVTGSGYERHDQTLSIERGDNGQVTVTLVPLTAKAPGEPPPPSPSLVADAPGVPAPPVKETATTESDSFALLFDGQEAHVYIDDFEYNGKYPVTIEAFVTPFTRISQQEQCVFSCRGGGSSGICLCLDQSGHWVFRLSNSSPQSNELATLYRRVHVAGVFDRQWCWLFVDGKQQGGRVKTGFRRTHPYSYVGADPNHYREVVNRFNGLIEQVRISKIARYQGNFEPQQTLSSDSDTVLLYRFDQGSGSSVPDLSGNGHDGLIKSAKWVRPDDFLISETGGSAETSTTSRYPRPSRWLGYTIHEQPEHVASFSGYTNIVFDRSWDRDGDAVIRAAREHGLNVVLEFHSKDRDGIGERLFALAEANQDVVIAICWTEPYFANYSPSALSAFAQEVCGRFPNMELWASFVEKPRGERQTLPVPAEVAALVVNAYYAPRPDDVAEKSGTVGGWVAKAGQRPVLLRWITSDPKHGVGIVPDCQPETISELARVAERWHLSGLLFDSYGPRENCLGLVSKPSVVEEIERVADYWNIATDTGRVEADSSEAGPSVQPQLLGVSITPSGVEREEDRSSSTAAATGSTPQQSEQVFVSIFDGKTLDGWEGSAKHYLVEDGKLVSNFGGKMYMKHDGGNLLTLKEYGDFILQFDFKVQPKANSGVLIRTPKSGYLSRTGMEIQILDDSCQEFAGLKNTRPWMLGIAGVAAPKLGHQKPVGQWNSMEIACQRHTMKLTLNGTQILDANLDKLAKNPADGESHPGLKREKGHIGFWGYCSCGRVEYRNLRIKELKPEAREPADGISRAESTGGKISETPPLAVAPFDEKAAKEYQRRWAEHLDVPVETTDSIDMRMVMIPPGEFDMGSSRVEIQALLDEASRRNLPRPYVDRISGEGPQHRVQITKPFYMGTCEVTYGQFRQFVAATGYRTNAERDGQGSLCLDTTTGRPRKRSDCTWQNSGFPQTNEHPVVSVDWNDAAAFCQWLSNQTGQTYRLPSEAEWEFACRSGTTTRWSTGDQESAIQHFANVTDESLKLQIPKATQARWAVPWDDGVAFAAPAGQFRANAFGLHDMHGNVWEWCQDRYDSEAYQRPVQMEGSKAGLSPDRVVRGGSWLGGHSECSRSAYRSSGAPGGRCSHDLGFRVVCEIREESGLREPTNTLAESRPAEGWKLLFDGKTLDGWHPTGSGDWTIEDGAIVGRKTKSQSGPGHLVADGEFGDFTLRLKFKIPRGDSGVYFRGKEEGEYGFTGPQVQILPPDDVGGLLKIPVKRRADYQSEVWSPSPEKAGQRMFVPNGWNDLELSAKGQHVSIHVNRVLTAEVHDEVLYQQGKIAIQLWGDNDTEVFVKNVRILAEMDADSASVQPKSASIQTTKVDAPGKKIIVPEGALEFEGHYYQFFNSPLLTWHLAAEHCRELGGHLARIESDEEQDFVVQHVRGTNKRYWIDGNDELMEGVWRFSDGKPMQFMKWRSGEPNTIHNKVPEHSLALDARQQNCLWIDEAAVARLSFVCEWDQLGETSQDTPKRRASRASRDAIRFAGHRYRIWRIPVTWHVAKAQCEAYGGHLVRIESEGEQRFVETMLRNMPDCYWADGTDARTEGQWQYSSGKPLLYFKWAEGYLNNLNQGQHYLQILGRESKHAGQWDDVSDGVRQSFICEWDF